MSYFIVSESDYVVFMLLFTIPVVCCFLFVSPRILLTLMPAGCQGQGIWTTEVIDYLLVVFLQTYMRFVYFTLFFVSLPACLFVFFHTNTALAVYLDLGIWTTEVITVFLVKFIYICL